MHPRRSRDRDARAAWRTKRAAQPGARPTPEPPPRIRAPPHWPPRPSTATAPRQGRRRKARPCLPPARPRGPSPPARQDQGLRGATGRSSKAAGAGRPHPLSRCQPPRPRPPPPPRRAAGPAVAPRHCKTGRPIHPSPTGSSRSSTASIRSACLQHTRRHRGCALHPLPPVGHGAGAPCRCSRRQTAAPPRLGSYRTNSPSMA